MTPEQEYEAIKGKHRALMRVSRAANKRWNGLSMAQYMHNGAPSCKRCGAKLDSRNYAELRLSFSDGSFHITPVCSKCTSGWSLPDLEALYCADMFALADEEDRLGVLQFWNMMADREVTGYEQWLG